MAAPTFSWLDDFFGPAVVKLGAYFFTKRPVLEFASTGTGTVEVEDNPINDSVLVTISGAAPGGAVGSLQYHGVDGLDDVFLGSDAVVNADGGLDFTRAAQTALAKSGWKITPTANDMPTVLAPITVPSGLGDCFVTVHVEITYYYASSGAQGGCFSGLATFTRTSGTFTRIALTDLTLSGMSSGTAVGGYDIVINGSQEIDVKGTGIAATNITWVVSLHVQVAK